MRILSCVVLMILVSACASVQPHARRGQAELRPNDPVFQALKAEIASARGMNVEASAALTEVALGSDDTQLIAELLQTLTWYGSLTDALVVAEHLTDVAPNDLQSWWQLAGIELTLNQYKNSARHYKMWLQQQDPAAAWSVLLTVLTTHDEPYASYRVASLLHNDSDQDLADDYALGLTAMQAEAYDHAERIFSKLLTKDYEDSQQPFVENAFWLWLQSRFAQNEHDEVLLAAADKLKTASDDETRANWRNEYALLLARAERFAEAQLELELLIEDAPRYYSALRSLGIIALERGRYAQAEQYFQQLLGLEDQRQDALYLLGETAAAQNQTDQALRFFLNVTEGRRVMDAQQQTAAMLAKRGELDEGIDMLLRLAERYPEQRLDLLLAGARLAAEYDDIDVTMSLLGQAQFQFGARRRYQFEQALVLDQINDDDGAIAVLEGMVKQHPNDPHVLNSLGFTLTDSGRSHRRAKRLITRAYEMRPYNPAIIDSMGWVLYQLGDTERALGYLRQAYDLTNDPEIAAHYAEALWSQGRTGSAQHVWEQASREFPDNDILRATKERWQQP